MTEQVVDLGARFRSEISALAAEPARPLDQPVEAGSALTGAQAIELFESQATSRHLDLAARRLGGAGRGYYSIGSAGHEGNAAVAAALRVTDPALLHYRSGAFFVHRARQIPGLEPIRDVLLGVVAAAADPISGGRHKVFGSKAASVIPQTSTIASQLPRAVGLAFAIERAARLGVDCEWPADSVVLCSFGDASANHSTAAGAINAAIHTAHQGVPVPLLFVCEDNGIGISVPTPPDWIEQSYGIRLGIQYFDADGCDLFDAVDTATAAADWVRLHRTPAFLHLRTVRLLGHAGSDVEAAYRRPADIAADIARDPVTATARLLVTAGVATPNQLIDRYDSIGARVAATAESVWAEPKLTSAAAVTASLAPLHPAAIRADVRRVGPVSAENTRSSIRDNAAARAPGGRRAGAGNAPSTLAQAINHTLAELLERDLDVLVFGEDVGRKGGVYGVTKGLQKAFGVRRVFDTLLDEQSVLGTALGAALAGFVPIPEIQYLAYIHNAADQLRGEAATLQFFSGGRYRNPMVIRIAGLAYQKGFGGHFHNDNSIAALRDIPGLILAVPARADDAAAMLRTCVSAARVDGRVCVFLEPIALYHTRDLHRPGDNGWLAPITTAATSESAIPTATATKTSATTTSTADFSNVRDTTTAGTADVPDIRDATTTSTADVLSTIGTPGITTIGTADTTTAETSTLDIGRARVYGAGRALTIVTFANGVPMSLRVAQRLSAEGNIRVLDLRWLAPLPVDDLLHHARATGRVLIADETRHTGAVSDAIVAALVDAGFDGRIARVTSQDSFVPLGPAADTVLLAQAQIEAAAAKLLTEP